MTTQHQPVISSPSDATKRRLAFAVRFAQLDLAHLRPGDLLNVRDDLARFLEPDERGPELYAVAVGMKTITVDALRVIQAAMYAIVMDYLGLRDWTLKKADLHPVRLEKMISPALPDGPPRVVATGDTRDIALEVLFSVLASGESKNLRRCPECGTIFLRVRKQLYCSRRCVNRANKRAWLLTPKGQRASQGSRRRAYVKHQQKKYGRKVRVKLNGPRKG